jgi:hypothetical protein
LKSLINLYRFQLIVLFLIAVVGCATTPSNEPKGGATTSMESSSGVAAQIPPDSKFAKISKGMSMKQVEDLIGPPTDSSHYATGKAFIPFYFGNDMIRRIQLYKGEGQIIYVGGSGVSGGAPLVDEIIYNPNETGYNK